MKDNTYLLVFHTEGEPHDRGFDLTSCASDIKEKLNQYFKEIFIFTPRTLKELPGSEDFCNSWSEPLEKNPNANHVGYFDFKSFLISHVLQKIPEGAILLYHDGNFKRNPQYWESDWHIMPRMLDQLLTRSNTDLFFQLEQTDVKVKWHVKGHVLETFFPDPIERDLVADSCLIGAARIVLRNTNFARCFIEDYKKACLRKDLLAKSPLGNCYPEFKWSCGDQDVLNAIVYRYVLDGKLPVNFPDLIFMYRVMTFSNRTFTWKFDGPKESWHDRPHPTGAQTIQNTNMINYIQGKRK